MEKRKILVNDEFIESLLFKSNCEGFIRDVTLPRDMNPEKEVWEELGFVFQKIKGNRHMYQAILPSGWNIQGTDDILWNEIVDNEGNVRGTIFDKLSMSLEPKYKIYAVREDIDNSAIYEYYFGTDEEKIYSSEEVVIENTVFEENHELMEMILDSERQKVMDFADSNYPDWNNVTAYWSKEKANVKRK